MVFLIEPSIMTGRGRGRDYPACVHGLLFVMGRGVVENFSISPPVVVVVVVVLSLQVKGPKAMWKHYGTIGLAQSINHLHSMYDVYCENFGVLLFLQTTLTR